MAARAAAGISVHPIHAGAQQVTGGVLGHLGQRDDARVEVDGLAAPKIHEPAAGQHHAQALHPAARRAIFQAARAAGIGAMAPPMEADASVGSGG
jgi:hypothetical protein